MSLLAAEKRFSRSRPRSRASRTSFSSTPNIKFRLGDFLKTRSAGKSFRSCCELFLCRARWRRRTIRNHRSAGRWRSRSCPQVAKVLKTGGLLIMTAPCGKSAVMAPWCPRVYGSERLRVYSLHSGLEKERYWVKDEQNRWTEVDRRSALSFEPRHDPAILTAALTRSADLFYANRTSPQMQGIEPDAHPLLHSQTFPRSHQRDPAATRSSPETPPSRRRNHRLRRR